MLLADAAATEAAGASIAPLLRIGDVVALAGDLGAGKTSLARGILAGLGLAGKAASPTFPILIPYAPPAVRLPVAHADLYRIEQAHELEELGLDELLEESALLVEWPERLGGWLWPQTLRLSLEPAPDGGRRLTWAVPEAWERRWPPPGFAATP
ncbi:tRNA (adenosine(37)-N6)-threonylcarbamoyltransferase complex ATPase subunit type 1 TsaE [Sphingomonas quercus]|uniref:tRNA (Adenosine(37)-N6)-threonylcarbamoyltransferase complex ATPase subunit type 1 TsaE n=1 Tax=Sphingomonas quercus TaxID=2842451 RepID=A0ABS6BJJ6_9SPHN|nr:tRNA (adenosine(37)-N6)-threonylcarbamoyltransferase complex ATPase subunit type 1 TsaE [Sphingomonas quercus]MBU3078349.1 tRNA (adenosine(37)-N6)-threonylcarbamoyltransferase complex ATPase subunit type 1 TsaE [Sphingomonas quercus]